MNWHTKHYPGCGHTITPPDCPPNPGGGGTVSSSIDMYIPMLLIFAFILIVYLNRFRKK